MKQGGQRKSIIKSTSKSPAKSGFKEKTNKVRMAEEDDENQVNPEITEFENAINYLHDGLRKAQQLMEKDITKKDKKKVDEKLLDAYAKISKENKFLRKQNMDLKHEVDTTIEKGHALKDSIEKTLEKNKELEREIKLYEDEILVMKKLLESCEFGYSFDPTSQKKVTENVVYRAEGTFDESVMKPNVDEPPKKGVPVLNNPAIVSNINMAYYPNPKKLPKKLKEEVINFELDEIDAENNFVVEKKK